MKEQRIVDITKELLQRIGFFNPLVEVFFDGEQKLQVRVRIKEDVGVLIGRGGETLRALQHLLLLIVSSKTEIKFGPGKFVFDVNDYFKEREGHLISMAKNAAHEAKETKMARELEVMPASERRIIHVALADDTHIKTESTGKKGERRVVIRPV